MDTPGLRLPSPADFRWPHLAGRVALLGLALLGLALWPLRLSAADVVPASGQRRSLHYRPADTVLGDVHPYFENGLWYLYYLRPGDFQVGLVESPDLWHWMPARLRHEAAGRDAWFRPYYVLQVFRDERRGVYRSYYGAKQHMVGSLSTDLHTWTPAPREFSVPPQAELYASQRDPFVFWNASEKQYWCLTTARVHGAPPGRDGAVGYATSPDLLHWTPRGHLFYPGNIGEPECPQLFPLGRSWYLLASVYDRAVGKPSYWAADAPTGPWRSVGSGSLDGKDLCAAQVASDGRRLLLFGWVPLRASSPGNQHWGGHLALPREVYPLAHNVLATRLPESLAAAARGPLVEGVSLSAARGTAGRWHASGTELSFSGGAEYGSAALPGRYDRGDLEVTVEFSSAACRAGVLLATSPDSPSLEIAVERKPARLSMGPRAGTVYSELPLAPIGDAPLRLQVLFEDDLVEVFLDGRYSLVARTAQKLSAASVGLMAQGAPVRFRDLRLFQLHGVR